jgi:hypothetical protein
MGGELPDICALRSSTALTVNVFEYWAEKSPAVIGTALGCANTSSITYEAQYQKPRPVRGFPPNLDVEVSSPNLGVGLSPPMTGIEVKFFEPYDAPKRPALKPVYGDRHVWEELGLPQCAILASAIVRGAVSVSRFDSAQLLKHVLGMTNQLGNDGYTLTYLWYREGGPEASEHDADLQTFAAAISGEVDFRVLTFQQLYASLAPYRREHPAYFTYLDARYF